MNTEHYTSIEQSKKLLELGMNPESADMFWRNAKMPNYIQYFVPFIIHEWYQDIDLDVDIPCWSVGALLGVLPLVDFTTPQLIGTPKTLYRCIYNDNLKSHAYENPVDACYEMILKLHEMNLL